MSAEGACFRAHIESEAPSHALAGWHLPVCEEGKGRKAPPLLTSLPKAPSLLRSVLKASHIAKALVGIWVQCCGVFLPPSLPLCGLSGGSQASTEELSPSQMWWLTVSASSALRPLMSLPVQVSQVSGVTISPRVDTKLVTIFWSLTCRDLLPQG